MNSIPASQPSLAGCPHPPEQREYFVDATVAASFLGINRRTLMKMARESILPAHPLGDGERKLIQ